MCEDDRGQVIQILLKGGGNHIGRLLCDRIGQIILAAGCPVLLCDFSAELGVFVPTVGGIEVVRFPLKVSYQIADAVMKSIPVQQIGGIIRDGIVVQVLGADSIGRPGGNQKLITVEIHQNVVHLSVSRENLLQYGLQIVGSCT